MSLLERFWPAVSQALTVNGDVTGILTVASTSGFYSHQLVELSGTALTTVQAKVLEVLSSTTLRVGSRTADTDGNGISCITFTTVASSKIYAASQKKYHPGNDEVTAAIYEAQPAAAVRVMTVDRQGNYIDASGGAGGTVVTVNGSVTATTTNASFQFVKVANATITAANANVTTAYPVMTISANVKVLTVLNSLNATIGLTLNRVQFQELEATEGFVLDLAANNRHINSSVTIGIYNVSVTPTAGTIRFQVVS